MKKDFIVERAGKSFVLYAGLLAEAHEQGLTSITTEIVQIPTTENNQTAICTATVCIQKDDKTLTFTGIGDASPKNVAPAMQQCLIRMAETRAKARALRDAVNVGVAALEELGDDDATDNAPEYGYQQPKSAQNRATRPAQEAKPDLRVVTPEQIEAAEEASAWVRFVEAARANGCTFTETRELSALAKEMTKSAQGLPPDERYLMAAGELSALEWESAINAVKAKLQANSTKAVIG